MASKYFMSTPGRGPGQMPDLVVRRELSGDDPTVITDGGPFVVTNVNCTPALNNIGGIPMCQFAGAGASTDGSQTQVRLDGIRPQASAILRMCGLFRSADLTHQFAAVFSVIDTSIIASNPTDVIGFRKAASATSFTMFARKASGTEETATAGGITLAADTTYFYEFVIKRDANTAGKGRMDLYVAPYVAGNLAPRVGSMDIATQLPDTVDLAASRAFLAGGAVTTLFYWGAWGWSQEAA